MPTLDFKGKQIVYSHHLTVPSRTLEVDAKKSSPPPEKANPIPRRQPDYPRRQSARAQSTDAALCRESELHLH